jgi:Sec-independent protein translocase protein TatA
MEILGIGAPELALIVLIALIVLGPKDMQKAGRTIGRWLNSMVHSDSWRVVQKTSHELRNLPNNLMREANLEMMRAGEDIQAAVDPRVLTHTPSKITSQPNKLIPSKSGNDPLEQDPEHKRSPSSPAKNSEHTIQPPKNQSASEETKKE